jgi:ferredoxin-type protein NapH
MKTTTLRTLIASVVVGLVALGFITNLGIGTISAFGWSDLSILCPLGALATMLAAKMVVPRAVISLIFALAFIIILGRAFCAWICPVPIVQKVCGIFRKNPKRSKEDTRLLSNTTDDMELAVGESSDTLAPTKKQALKTCSDKNCNSCAEHRGKIDARHFVLGGSLLSAAVFGFPVFCLVCPIGLSFASILLIIRLFSGGDVTWSLVFVPVVLLAEVVIFKKWCGKLCPLAAFMSLVGKANRTFRPQIDDSACLDSTKSHECRICAKVCPEGIDPRHPENGNAWSECTKCLACKDACPTYAIKLPVVSKLK